MSIYSPGVNQFIMRYLVRELAGEERKQVLKSGWKASQSSEPPGWGCMGSAGGFLGEGRGVNKLVGAPEGFSENVIVVWLTTWHSFGCSICEHPF